MATVRGTDEDSGREGDIDYSFIDDTGNTVNIIHDFSINMIRGIITAQRVFDRDDDPVGIYEVNMVDVIGTV